MTRSLNVLRFPGIHPDTLGHYLSGLGLLAAVGRKWPDVRGCWQDRRFVLLHETLTEEQVCQYLLAEWQPTKYERWWATAQKSKDDAKLRAERKERSIGEVKVMEAHLVGTKQNSFNPIFGAGGTLGQRKFASVWTDCLKKARPSIKPRKEANSTSKKPPKPAANKAQLESDGWLRAALWEGDDVELLSISATGTWFVFANKSFNTGQDWFREGRLSPWSYLLAVEGAFLLIGDVNRRLGAKARPYAAFPFVCDPAQPATAGEVGMLKGEFWAPLWDHPATLAEIRHLLRRGLARVGSRLAHAPAEFAVAALGAGTDAGIAEFARFELRQTTSAKVYEAVPREHIAVARLGSAGGRERLEAAELLAQLIPWLDRLPYEPRTPDQRGKFRGFRGPVETAIVRVSEAVGSQDEPERWQHLLLELARQQTRIDSNQTFRENRLPLPRLDPRWFDRAWPEGTVSDEIAVARAVASIGADTTYPLLVNVFGVDLNGRQLKFVGKSRPAGVVWSDGEPARVLSQVLHRRLVDGPQLSRLPDGGTDHRFMTGTCLAPWRAITSLLVGTLDLDRIAIWVPALTLIDWQGRRPLGEPREDALAGVPLLMSLLRPLFHHCPKRVLRWLPPEAECPPRPAIARRALHLIQTGNVEAAIQVAKGYYRAAGCGVVDIPTAVTTMEDLPIRLAAALLIPRPTRTSETGWPAGLSPGNPPPLKETTVPDPVSFDSLVAEHKLLAPDGPVCLIVQATMGVAAGLDRFQPAGFPEIGHVIYDAPRDDGRSEKVCIVDSPASMANHLEQVCMAGENDPSLLDALDGLPYVKCVTDRGPQASDESPSRLVATTLTEGHRLASDYFLDGHRLGDDNEPVEATFRDELRAEFGVIEVKKDKTYFITPDAWWTIYKTLFKYDPNSLVHGVLFAKEQIKVSRLLTAHLEALGAARVGRSGVKFDRLGKTTSGQPIFAVDEETAREIRATFIIDLAMLRSYGRQQGRGDTAQALGLTLGQKKLLLALSIWKVRELLRRTFSYRSGCKLKMQSVTIRTDDQSDTESIATELPTVDMAAALGGADLPADGDAVTVVYYPARELFQPSGDKTPAESGDDEAEAGDESEE